MFPISSAKESGVHIENLTAIVSVTDDGGSSGRLRADSNVLAPGDLRNCIVSLAEGEALLSRVFQHRFTSAGQLDGHNLSNLFITPLTALTGDFSEVVELHTMLERRSILEDSASPGVRCLRRLDGRTALPTCAAAPVSIC